MLLPAVPVLLISQAFLGDVGCCYTLGLVLMVGSSLHLHFPFLFGGSLEVSSKFTKGKWKFPENPPKKGSQTIPTSQKENSKKKNA